MKKIALLLICALTLMSCEIEDDSSGPVQVFVEVTDADLPESFEQGNVYQIEFTYSLPDACHVPLGLQVGRGSLEGPARREIYVAGVAARTYGEGECDREGEGMEQVETYAFRIDEDQPYTFYLWAGLDENQESVYTEIVVPVVESTPSATEE